MDDTVSAPVERAPKKPARLSPLLGNVELVVVILLGIVSVATAYTSFQGALYGGQSADASSKAQNDHTEAESLYLEGNQQYVQDAQTVLHLAELKIDAKSADAITADDASAKYDEIYFIGVSDDLDKAIKRADAKNASDAENYTYPLDDKKYQASLFTDYADKSDAATAMTAKGESLGANGDRLGLYTALMAITLFLLGVGAVMRRPKLQWVLIAVGMTIFSVTAVFTALVPFVWI